MQQNVLKLKCKSRAHSLMNTLNRKEMSKKDDVSQN
uniref:Uncharacterized protein n=1 Tax=Arundo donax TaxID=35708 RepID=A0A0A9FGM0_ARUDO